MSDHLPECPYSKPCPEEWRNERKIKAEGLPVPHRIVSGSSGRCVECDAGDCICEELRFGNACAVSSFAAGVQAAREAVAGLLDEFPNPDFQIANAAVHTALAAIDALRGES